MKSMTKQSKRNDCDEREDDWPEALYCRNTSFRFRRVVNGHKYREVWGKIPLDKAIRKATRYNLDIEEGIDPISVTRKKNQLLDAFAYDVWLKQKSYGDSKSTPKRYRAVIDNFIHYIKNIRRINPAYLASIDYAMATDYITYRATTPIAPNGSKYCRTMKKGASKKTLHFEKTVLSQMFKEAVKRKFMSCNPFEDVTAKKPSAREIAKKHRKLTPEEQTALLEAAKPINYEYDLYDNDSLFYCICLFDLNTGLRLGEVIAFEWTDIDWDRRVISVVEKEITETRCIPIPTTAIDAIKRLIKGKDASELLLPNGDELSKRGIHLSIRRKEDLQTIKVGGVDIEGKTIVATHTYTWKPKGMEGDVPMSQKVYDLLRQLEKQKHSNFVFAHHDGGRCRLKLLKRLKAVQVKAKIGGNLRFHDLRHTFAFRLREKGAHLETIKEILRHADIRDTLIYASYDIKEGTTAVSLLD